MQISVTARRSHVLMRRSEISTGDATVWRREKKKTDFARIAYRNVNWYDQYGKWQFLIRLNIYILYISLIQLMNISKK